MKFLNLETGYTFDGIWKNTANYTDWVYVDRITPIKCKECNYVSSVNDSALMDLMKDPTVEILYTDNENETDVNSSNWYSEFNYDTSSKYAYRVRIPQTKGYIYWFPNEQSTGIVYNMPICVLTEDEKPLNISIEENDVFTFVRTTNKTTDIDGYTFIEPEFLYNITTTPQKLGKYYAHVFNIACKSEMAGEYICKVTLDDEHYFRVGADLYGEYEPVRINLSNMGVELPDMVQKAIYDVDPHEDAKNSIIINRKFKELLINYWDVVANKGSYKSLVNSIKWFEWYNLEVKEIWKHIEVGKFMFDDRQILSLLENKIQNQQHNFVKTSYIALYCSIYDELDEYDIELNPILSKAVSDWSKEDLRLKMALLAQYFGMHFMPIHLSLMHAVAEDKVFTNTIKNIHANEIKRDDSFADLGFVECNIKDNSRFVLNNVRAQVTDKTLFGIKDINNSNYFGVDVFPKNEKIDNIKLFANKYYTGPGVIIPIEFVLPNQSYGDFLKHTIVISDNRLDFYDIVYVRNNKITIRFNLLLTTPKDYSYTFTFILASGKTLTRTLNFSVTDPDSVWINTYKILSKSDLDGFTYNDFKDTTIGKYFFKIQKSTGESIDPYYKYYLPLLDPSDDKYDKYNGIKLNRTIVLHINDNLSGEEAIDLKMFRKWMSFDYLEFERYDNGVLKYLTYVSKKFYSNTPSYIDQYKYLYEIIRNDLGFYPQFHKLQLLNGDNIKDYTINQYDALCCIPVTIQKNKTIDFKYGYKIEDFEWEFINRSLHKDNIIKYPSSSQQPFIAKNEKNTLTPGYYGIKFRYKLSDDDSKYNELNINSAFRVVHI